LGDGIVDALQVVEESNVFVAALVSVGRMDGFANDEVHGQNENVHYQRCQRKEVSARCGSMYTYTAAVVMELSCLMTDLYIPRHGASPPPPPRGDIV
jgi:hypothetical protein